MFLSLMFAAFHIQSPQVGNNYAQNTFHYFKFQRSGHSLYVNHCFFLTNVSMFASLTGFFCCRREYRRDGL